MKQILFILALVFFSACSYGGQEEFRKNIKINSLICPAEFSQERVHKDLNECKYYDEEAAVKASKSSLSPECIRCLKKKGYKLEK